MHRIFLGFKPSIKLRACLLAILTAFALLTACRSPQVTGEDITISITADGDTQSVTLPSGSTVTQALQAANITLGNLDRAEPPLYTVLNNGDSVRWSRDEHSDTFFRIG